MNFCNVIQWRDFLLITKAASSFSGLSMTRHSTFYIWHPFLNVINVGLGVLMEHFQMHVLLMISCFWLDQSFSHMNTYVMLIHALLIYLVSISISKVAECHNLNARHSYFACDRKVWKIILTNICNQETMEKWLWNGYITTRTQVPTF